MTRISEITRRTAGPKLAGHPKIPDDRAWLYFLRLFDLGVSRWFSGDVVIFGTGVATTIGGRVLGDVVTGRVCRKVARGLV